MLLGIYTKAQTTWHTLKSRFVDERRQAIGGGAMSQEDKDALFQQFQSWQRGLAR